MKEKELNREERNKTVMETGALVMAEFYADWCPHCQKMMPIVKEFKELEKGKLEVVQINIEEESALADLYTVESIPTFILLKISITIIVQIVIMNNLTMVMTV